MAVSLADFCAALTDLQLVTGQEFRDIMTSLSATQIADVELFAKALTTRKLLTKYQAQAILSGQAKRLILGSYLLLDQIGKGGMGVVLKAQHLRLKRTVAVKVLSPQVTHNPAALKRFQREVQAISKLEHPNIVVALDADVARGVHFLVMQYVDGRDLATIIQEEGPFSVEQAVQCLSQTACGLEYAHNQGVTHRDIKPANLLLERTTGTVKILDMGLARIDEACGLGMEGDTGLTNTGTIMGTVDFMSPEQAANTKKADHRSDIYSLGITLFYLLTGQLPYNGDTVMEKLLAHREQPIPSLGDFRTDIPVAVEALFRKMVAKNPNDRYQTMSEVLAALLACLAEAPTTAASPTNLRVAVAEDSMDSELRAFVNGLDKEEDTDAGYVPGQATEVTSTNPQLMDHVSPLKPRSSKIEPIPTRRHRQDGNYSWGWIAGGTVLLLLIVGGTWWLLSGPSPPSVAKRAKPLKAGTSKSGTEEEESEVPKVAIAAGSLPALAKLPPLPPGAPPAVLPGLIAEPAKLAGNRRWQVDTITPRSPVVTAAWSPDSRQVVVGCQAGELRIYDVPSWTLRSVMIAHAGGVRHVAWNRDGSRIASSGGDNVIRLWQPDGTPGPVLRECASPGTLAWSPDGQYLIAASTDGGRPFIPMFSAEGRVRRIFSGHTAGIRGLAWSTDGKHFVSASEDATLRVWDLIGTTVCELTGHEKGLYLVAWSSSGALATADSNGTVYVYPDTAHPPHITKNSSPRGLAWSPDGKRLAVGLNSQIQLWDFDGQMILEQEYLDSQAIAWSPDGRRLVGCGPAASIWEPGKNVTPLSTHVWPTSLDMDPEGTQFVTGHANGTLRWWRQNGESAHAASASEFSITSVAWSVDGRHIASGSQNQVRLWSPDGRPGITIESRGNVHQVEWSPDGKQVAAACHDSKVRLWETDGTAGPVLEGHVQNVTGLAWSREGQLATVGSDGTVRLWTGNGLPGPVLDVTPKNQDLASLAWSPDGQQFGVYVGNRSEIRIQLWNADGTDGPALKGPKQLTCFSWSPDGQRLIGCDAQGDFRFWSRDGYQGPTFPGPGLAARCLSWSKGNRLVTAGDDRVIRFWDATNFKPIWLAVTLSNGDTATLSADGKVIHSTGNVEQTVAYFVERNNGRLEVLTPKDFSKLVPADSRK